MTVPAQLDLVGRHIDRLVTVRARIMRLQVNGMPADASCAIATLLGCVVRNGPVGGFKRAFQEKVKWLSTRSSAIRSTAPSTSRCASAPACRAA